MSTTAETPATDDKPNFDKYQKDHIAAVDKAIESILSLTKEGLNFKVGEVYIKEVWPKSEPKRVSVKKNHLGFPAKFKVVHISAMGVPYLQLLNADGKTYGALCIPPGLEKLEVLAREYETNNPWGYGDWEQSRFAPDPDQMDAILLGENFDPMAAYREKSKLYAEVQKHNKSVTVPSGWGNEEKVKKFLLNLPLGQQFWTSTDNVYTIQLPPTRDHGNWFINVLDKNQASKKLALHTLYHKRIYKAQPRSFKRESRA